MNSQTRLQRLCDLYARLDASTLDRDLLAEVYDEQIHFSDPLHKVEGLDALTSYFRRMYRPEVKVAFSFGQAISEDDRDFLPWQMTFCHPRLNRGDPIVLDGGSSLQWQNGYLVKHQDLFDSARMLFEHIPVIGFGIRHIRKQLQQGDQQDVRHV